MSTYINTRTNERRDVIFKYSDIPVTVDYFWDDHGEFTSLTACGHQTSFWSSAEAEIHKYSYTESLINQGANFSIYQLVVNGQDIPGEVISSTVKVDATGQKSLYCKVEIGWS